MTRHVWRIKKQAFRQLRSGAKTLEVRLGHPHVKKVKVGDSIVFENYDGEFRVVRVAYYDTFLDALKTEDVYKIFPGMLLNEALRRLLEIYPTGSETLGVYVFELKDLDEEPELITPELQFCRASDLLRNDQHRAFAKLIHESYMITGWLCEEYPSHCDDYYAEHVHGLFDNESEIISCYVDDNLAATAFITKNNSGRRINTLYVKPRYRNQGIGTLLLNQCFSWLGTTKPLVSIAGPRLEEFTGFIQQYGWRKNQIIKPGFFNAKFSEYVFNGGIE